MVSQDLLWSTENWRFLCPKSPEIGRGDFGAKILAMALNVKALIPVNEHPEVTNPIVEDHARAGADKEKGFDPEQGARERALNEWEEQQRKLKRANHLQLLDVL